MSSGPSPGSATPSRMGRRATAARRRRTERRSARAAGRGTGAGRGMPRVAPDGGRSCGGGLRARPLHGAARARPGSRGRVRWCSAPREGPHRAWLESGLDVDQSRPRLLEHPLPPRGFGKPLEPSDECAELREPTVHGHGHIRSDCMRRRLPGSPVRPRPRVPGPAECPPRSRMDPRRFTDRWIAASPAPSGALPPKSPNGSASALRTCVCTPRRVG